MNNGTLAKSLILNEFKSDEIEGICPININISISRLPKIKLKQVRACEEESERSSPLYIL